ncbi:MAG: penicillin-insensitive murein endopeptidase [Proteobacteria bacterium]|nr:penicillin-insensitive murein endopeptidase [Pseudomonadota bacterium]
MLRLLAIPFLTLLVVLHWIGGSAAADPRTWIVRSGDALWTLANRFEVSVEQIRAWNNLNDNTLQIGQELVVAGKPGAPTPATSDEGVADTPASALTPASLAKTYRVRQGDTLSEIAERFALGMDQLLSHNPSLHPDRIREGQILHLATAQRQIAYEIQPGDYAGAIAARYGVKITDIARWNPGLDPDHIRAGGTLVIYTERPASHSQSLGSPSDGSLLRGRRLPRHSGYVIRDSARAWGTLETVQALVSGFDAVRKAHKKRVRVRVHDLSLRNGGPMQGHSSHQSGRDVDLAYYQRRCPSSVCPFQYLHPSQLDVARQWTLLEHWLAREQLEAAFVDYRLQARLYRHARAQGASRSELLRWFQYPRGPGHPAGIIRHYPKHADHIHVRFVCHESDPDCKAFRVYTDRRVRFARR